MYLLVQIIFLLFPVALFAFWFWMLWEMLHNRDLPPCFISFTNGLSAQFDWSVMFVILNVFTAIVYYLTIYRH